RPLRHFNSLEHPGNTLKPAFQRAFSWHNVPGSLSTYPDVSLKQARERCDAAQCVAHVKTRSDPGLCVSA
ncbi:hypothetical protein, partial [Metallibacterium sp.]|uniref:hypothetical protein n=1 Tax=Metallibacterium sp. TaxID=2940281 RepID=UPI0026230FC7